MPSEQLFIYFLYTSTLNLFVISHPLPSPESTGYWTCSITLQAAVSVRICCFHKLQGVTAKTAYSLITALPVVRAAGCI